MEGKERRRATSLGGRLGCAAVPREELVPCQDSHRLEAITLVRFQLSPSLSHQVASVSRRLRTENKM